MSQRLVIFGFLTLATCVLTERPGWAQEAESDDSIHEVRALLDSIDPYLPSEEIAAEIQVFGSTSMDTLAHGWATGFKKFHPQASVVISAEGSETVFKRLAENPSSIGMSSRPVTESDLAKLKESGLKRPVAVMVAREALGVFVHESNPLESITFEQLVAVFCQDDSTTELKWGAVGVSGPQGEQAVRLISRNDNSGTHAFVRDYIFRSRTLRPAAEALSSNAKVVETVEKSPHSIAICGLKCGSHAAKALHLREGSAVFPDDDHAVLVGRYPLTRPLTLVIDLGQSTEQAKANVEFVRYSLAQAGQMQAILSGFFPFDPPTLRAQELKLKEPEADKN